MKAKLGLLGLSAMMCALSAFAAPGEFSPAVLQDTTELADSSLPKRAVAGTGVIGNFNALMLQSAKITLNLSDGRSIRIKRTRENRRANGEHTWVGEIENMPGSMFVLTQYRGHVSGYTFFGNETWEVQAVGNGRGKLFQVDESKLPPEGPLPSGKADTAGSTAATITAPAVAASPVTHDLMVVYTPAAASQYGGADALRTMLLSAIDSANAAYANSQIGISLNLVDFRQVSYSETGDMNVSLTALQSGSDGKMDEVPTLRTQLGADIVTLLTTDTNYCGLGYLTGSAGSSSWAYNVVSPGCFSGHTLAHEIGHNQGNHHDRVDAGGSGAYPYSYGYRTCDYPSLANGQNFRTVMAYACGSTPRVNYFSNPNLFYNNAAQMGISYEADSANAADNARSMNNMAGVIAAYRSVSSTTVPVAPGNLNGSASSYNQVNLVWSDNSSDESGFVVQRATGSGSFADRVTLGAGVTSFADTGLSGSTNYSYRVRAYNSAGSSTYSNTVTVTTPVAPPPPSAPASASLTLASTTVKVSWADVTSETGYEVLRETYNSRKGTWSATTLTAGVDATSMSLSLSAGTYRFKVRAYNGSGYSAYTNVSCVGVTSCASDGSIVVGRK